MSMTSEIELLEQASQMAAEAEEANMGRCLKGEAVFYLPAAEAVRPGHIYSDAGRDEWKISRLCEFHFDGLFEDCDCCGKDEDGEATD